MKIQKPTISQWESSSANQEMNIANLGSKLERLNSNLLSTKAISNGWEDKYNETLVEFEQVRGERDKWYIQGNEFKEAWLNNMKRADLSEAELKDYTIYAEGQYAEIFGECRGWQVRAEKAEAENAQLKEELNQLKSEIGSRFL